MSKALRIIRVCIIVFMVMATVGFFPSISSLLALAFVLIILPINKLQEFYRSFKLTGIVKAAVLAVLFIGTVLLAPVTDTDENTIENGEDKTEFVEPVKPEEQENKTDSSQPAEEPKPNQEEPTEKTENTPAEKPEENTKPVENHEPAPEPAPEPEPEPKPEPEPEPTPELEKPEENSKTVYVTPTGSKYHYDNHCNNGTYIESTLEKAESMGLTPCKKCAGG